MTSGGLTGISGQQVPDAGNPYASINPATQALYDAAMAQYSGPNAQNDAADAAFAGLTPEQQQQVQQSWAENNKETGLWGAVDRVAPAVILGVGTGAIGAGVGSALGGGLAGGVGGGAAAGASGAVINGVAGGAPITAGSVGKGALLGSVVGGIGASGVGQSTTGALSNATGLNPALSAGLVRGAIGAGVGALSGGLSGSGAGRGAEIGAIAGGASGVAGNVTSSQAVGTAAGTIAGNLANKYLAPSSQAPSSTSALPSLPGTSSSGPTGSSVAPAANIGAYSGFSQDPGLGYAPRTQVANPVSNYATYGQGPEAQFFTGEQGSPAAPSMSIQPVPTTPQQRI